MKLSRLLRPGDPRFWLLLAFNAVSAAVSWVLQTQPLPGWLQGVFVVFALANFLLGLALARALLRSPDAPTPPAVPD